MKTIEIFNENGIKFANGFDTTIFPMVEKEFDSWDDKNNCKDSFIADVPDETEMKNIFGCTDICIANISKLRFGAGEWFFVPTSKLLELGFEIPEPMSGFEKFKVRSIGILR